MFGQKGKHDQRGRRPHGGCPGRGKGRGGRQGRGGQQGRGLGGGMTFRGFDTPEQAVRPEPPVRAPQQSAPQQTAFQQSASWPEAEAAQPGVCPICKNHCPLDDLGCDKGKAYATSLQAGERAAKL